MDHILKPKEMSVLRTEPDAAQGHAHWLPTFAGFIQAMEEGRLAINETPLDKKSLLVNFLSPKVYVYITDVRTYDLAKEKLDRLFETRRNNICARHVLASRSQQMGESLKEFIHALEILVKDCIFTAVDAETYRQGMLRDALNNGLASIGIRQRLQENENLTFQQAVDVACMLDRAQKQV